MKQNVVLLIIMISIVFGSIPFISILAQGAVEEEQIVEDDEEPPSSIITTNSTTIIQVVTTTTTTKIEKYPIARQIWNIMKSYGWSDIICAGVIGNMMRECGGDTFELQWDIINKSKNHYGLCQWSKKWHPNVWYKNVKEQLKYLKETLDMEIFNDCKTPEQAAYIFSKEYERPAQTDPEGKRRANARKAYSYFVEN